MADERTFPDVSFVDTDTEAMVEQAVESYESTFGRRLHPADPEKQRLLWYMAITSQTRSMINIAAKRNLPRYAEGDYLESISEIFYGISRQQATAAETKVRFTLSAQQEIDITVPEGTEITTPSGEVTFATTEDLVITAGTLTGEVDAECKETGTIGNGYEPGTLNVIIEPMAYIDSAENTTTSARGEEDEDDESLYNRMKESMSAYSTAGTAGSYKHHCMQYDPTVEDVVVTTPEPGCVDITVLLTGGEVPSTEKIEELQEYLSSDDIRALTDSVTVKAPVKRAFEVDITYCEEKAGETQESAIRQAVDDYLEWQTKKMGRKINPSKLVSEVMAAGASSVVVAKPTMTAIGETEIGYCTAVNIRYGGTE